MSNQLINLYVKAGSPEGDAEYERVTRWATARIAELEAETESQKDVIDMLAQSKAEIQAKQLETVRAWMAGCKTIAALDERVIAEIGKLRGEGL